MYRDLVTIVIPAYNAERFLRENIESIINQSYRRLEVIYVCDGCTDHTVEILQRYAKDDPRIIIQIEPENKGGALSRNIGMRMAKGDWIIFFDADDLYEPNMIEAMLVAAKKEHADISCCYWEYFDDVLGRNCYIENRMRKLYCNTYPIVETQKELNHIMQIIDTGPCTKLIHRSIYQKDKVFFQNIPNANDIYFSIVAVICSQKIVYVDKVLFHYRSNRYRNTLSTDRCLKKSYVLEACDKIYDYIKERQNNKLLLRSFYNFVLDALREYSAHAVYDDIFNSLKNIYFNRWRMEDEDIINELSRVNRIIYRKVLANKKEIDKRKLDMQAKIEFLREISEEGCSIWGVGFYGERLLMGISGEDIKIQHIYDSSPGKWGKKVYGYLIENYEENSTDNIIVTSQQYFDEIKGQIGNRAKNVYNLEEQIWMIPSEGSIRKEK